MQGNKNPQGIQNAPPENPQETPDITSKDIYQEAPPSIPETPQAEVIGPPINETLASQQLTSISSAQPEENQVPQSTPDLTPATPASTTPFTDSNQTANVITSQPKRKLSLFKIFVTLAILAVVIIYSIVGYLFLKNRKAESSKMTAFPSVQPTQAVSPTPSFSPKQIKIINGSIAREVTGGETTILIKKEDFPSTGIIGFAKVVVSPNNSKMCFESLPPAAKPALYVANIDGTQVAEISPNRQNCLWKSDSQKIFYVNDASQTSAVNIFLYDFGSKIEENLTQPSVPEGTTRRFSIVGLSADEVKLICKYEDVSTNQKSGGCEINLETKELTLL